MTINATCMRCSWAQAHPLMRQYHDDEWGRPVRDGRMLWEALMLEGFQAGLSWQTILTKREAFRTAFAGFDPVRVAKYGPKQIDLLMANERIVRSRAKIEATIVGARLFLSMAQQGEPFDAFCWSFTDGQVIRNHCVQRLSSTPLSERISAELKHRGFKFVGPTIVYAWLQAVGIVDDHEAGCFMRVE